MKQYKKLSEYAEENSVTYRTAWNRFKSGKIPHAFVDETGHIKIPLNPRLSMSNSIKRVALYARVSSNDRKKSLKTQLERLSDFSTVNGFQIKHSIKEIASGMNDNRKKLDKLLNCDDWDILIIENKDRLTRFGFNYLETLLNKLGKEIIVVNSTDEDDNEDIMKDLISIIYSFSARMYGLRRKKKKKEIVDFLEN